MIIYVTGGVRSGKSAFAQQLALTKSTEPIYIATAKIWDADFGNRVHRHQQERGPEWTTLEAPQDLYRLPLNNKVAVIDCVTLWLTNLFISFRDDSEATLIAFKNEIDRLYELDATLIIVSNEIGMGLHAETPLGRRFTDLQGWANQYVAAKASQAIFMVSGIPITLK